MTSDDRLYAHGSIVKAHLLLLGKMSRHLYQKMDLHQRWVLSFTLYNVNCFSRLWMHAWENMKHWVYGWRMTRKILHSCNDTTLPVVPVRWLLVSWVYPRCLYAVLSSSYPLISSSKLALESFPFSRIPTLCYRGGSCSVFLTILKCSPSGRRGHSSPKRCSGLLLTQP